MRRDRSESRRGAVAVVAALCLTALLGVMALAIDGAMLRAESQMAQVAADAAAYAAVRAYDKVQEAGGGLAAAEAAASAAAAEYAEAGYRSGDLPTITAVPVAPSARYGAADLAIRATVTRRPPRLFSGIFGGPAPTVSARAVATRLRAAGASVIILNRNAQDSLYVAGSARLVVPGEVRVKSNAARAANINNSGYVESTKLKVAGGYLITSGGVVKDSPGSIKSGVDPATIVDPLENLVHPSPTGLPTRTSPSGWNPTNPYPLQPGLYPNGLTLNAGGMNYTMAPGLYYIQSGNFTVTNGVRVTGSGVMVYLYNGDISIQGGEGTTLTAPTGGTYKGIVFFQRSPRDLSGDYTPRTINIANGTNNLVQGTVYAPGASVWLAGGSQTIDCAQLIVNKLNLSNDAKYRPTLPPPPGAASFHLAE